ncbi:MAG: hypothetical protein ACMXYM_05375 [Candidatus Woesearchaeota archaeon]
MRFELSEYLVFTGVVFVAVLITPMRSVLILSLVTFLLVAASYSLIIRMSADYERARVYRIVSAALIIAIGALIGTPTSIIIALWGLVTLLIASREHVSHRSFIPVHRS